MRLFVFKAIDLISLFFFFFLDGGLRICWLIFDLFIAITNKGDYEVLCLQHRL
jgi:hypothetical protein